MTYRVTRGQPHEYEEVETGERFFSCSQLLKVLDPHVYSYVDDAIMAEAQARGVDLHKHFFYLMASLRGLCPKPAPPREFLGYVQAMERWIHDRKPHPLLLEEPSVNRKWGVAGTKDFKGLIDKKVELIDLKTGGPLRIHDAQLNCYRTFEDCQDVQRMRTLYIHKDGTYHDPLVSHDPMHVAALENAVNVLRWRTQA